jgi:chemotaxis protein MotB
MDKNLINLAKGVLAIALFVSLTGCSIALYSRYPRDKARIKELSDQLAEMQKLKAKETEELKQALAQLQDKLKGEIDTRQVSVGMEERGLVITFVDEVLFDSGKTVVKPGAYDVLNRVADILKDKVIDKNIGVEGHTDNQPIKYSGWKSNWELSTARATSVLHYLVDNCGIAPERLQATGYGEYRPVASNLTNEGRQRNRRVEIIILPKITKADLENLERQKRAAEAGEETPIDQRARLK